VHTISGRLSVLLSVMASWLWTGLRTPSPKEKNSRVNSARSRACAEMNPLYPLNNILQDGDIITYANFGDDRLKGLEVAGAQSLPFHIDFDRRSYNTLALPCECVIIK